MADMMQYVKTDDLTSDVSQIIESAQRSAYRTVNRVLVFRNWLLGKRISEESMGGSNQERYGIQIIKELASNLTRRYGKGFDRSSLYRYVQFYHQFPKIVAAVPPQSSESPAGKTVAAPGQQSLPAQGQLLLQSNLLSWTQYRILLQVPDPDARAWYEKEAFEQTWSSRTLQRNISSQYYYRMLKTSDPAAVEREMQEKTSSYQDKLEFIRNPVIAEFLGMQEVKDYRESTLEQAIIDNLQKFLMELGKGYAFVARQQHIHTEKEEYYIDLVFYNYILKCFVLIDLKTSRITHQDVGQMDMYIRMYDELKKQSDDNPTLGIVLCTDTDEDIARYSVLRGNEQLFASKYKLYLPSEEELRSEIETQKRFFLLQREEQREQGKSNAAGLGGTAGS